MVNVAQKIIALMPGGPAFSNAKGKVLKAFWEFLVLLVFSLVPILVILLIEFLSGEKGSSLFSSFSQYIEAGQVFFYVGPIIGSLVWLIYDDFKEVNFEGSKKRERAWLLSFILVALCFSLVTLVLFHTDKLEVENTVLVCFSLAIYGACLYFWYVSILYKYANVNGDKKGRKKVDSIIDDLDGFGEEG